jgi:hypothetical protein
MSQDTHPESQRVPPRSWFRRILRIVLGVGLLFFFLRQVPKSYPLPQNPILIKGTEISRGGGLEGFDSPYLGHTGSWDGKGGAMFGASKVGDLDKERAMGLRWTFMPVHWRELEPEGPVDLAHEVPAAWKALDAFVIAAQARGLNILMQAPVVGGNAGGPPSWAGRREPGKSAPTNMAALAEFAGKLADRYRPGGTLARNQGWNERYGVRAWELDNEPEGYLTSWKGQSADYAEFVTVASQRIRASDSQAVIVGPGLAAAKHGLPWLAAALDATTTNGSPANRLAGKPYSIGPHLDVVSIHNYEGLDSAFNSEPRTIGQVFEDVRAVFDNCPQPSSGFTWEPKREFWHTEGNYDFIGALSAQRRAAWRFQFFTRAFACGLRKVCVMDPSVPEQTAIRTYISVLPNPFPLVLVANGPSTLGPVRPRLESPANPAFGSINTRQGRTVSFLHQDGLGPDAGQVWIIWPLAGSGDATVEVPVRHRAIITVTVAGIRESHLANDGKIVLFLEGDAKMPAPILVVDRPPSD